MDQAFLRQVNGDRIDHRQIDVLSGIARGLVADGQINQMEAEFLQKWLIANSELSNVPLFRTIYERISEMLKDGLLDADEREELFNTMSKLASNNFEVGEVLKSSSLPLCDPAPALSFQGQRYCFTGTFLFGQRSVCEAAVIERGAVAGSLTRKTNVLVIGAYVTDSWRHETFGNKILSAVGMRADGVPISIVSEEHWKAHL